MTLRLSDSVRVGPFRLRVSKPLTGRGSMWASVGTRTPVGYLKLSKPVGRTARRR